MSTRPRAPSVPVAPIPPYRGGPLQPREDMNTVGVDSRSATSSKQTSSGKAVPTVTRKPSHGASHRSSAHPTATYAQEQRAPGAARDAARTDKSRQSASRKPQKRLERENKPDDKDPPNIGPWKLGEVIGRGASGRVRIARHANTGQQAAVKIIPMQAIANSRMSIREIDVKQDKMKLGIEREIIIMKLIEHPNLLGLWDVYETSRELYLVMEYVAGGELFDHLVAKGRLRPSEARSYFRQIIFGMDYCHRFNICHRDLKPENLLLDATKKIVKVADFGMAALQPTERMLETSCGSPHYASPEIVSGKSYKGTASDIWSCGIILFALLCGRLPFDDGNIQHLLAKVRIGRFEMPDHLETDAKDLIWRMLEVNPEKRIKMPDIMKHRWFTNRGVETEVNPVTTSFEKLVDRPIDRTSIDPDILKDLKNLWPEYSKEWLSEQLLASGPNWQKTFYTLLVNHRDNHSAEDDDEGNEDDYKMDDHQSPHARDKPENSLGLSLGPGPREKARPRRSLDVSTAPVAQREAPAPRAEQHKYAPEHVPAIAKQEHSPTKKALADPPVIVKQERSARQSIDAPRLSATGRASMDAPRPSAGGRPLPSPVKPNTPVLHGPEVYATPPSDARVPQITFQGATPVGDEQVPSLVRRATSPTSRASASGTSGGRSPFSTPIRGRTSRDTDSTPKPAPRTSSRPASPTKSKRSSSSVSAGAPHISVPQVGDATMQRFFQEIADELASIRATGDRPESVQLKWERFKAGAAADVQNLEAHNLDASPAMSGGSDLTQFEDAEDDVSVFSGSESSGQPYTPTSPMPPMMPSPTTKTAPLAVVDKFSETGHNRYNTEVTPTNRSSRRAPTAGVSPRPASLFSTATGSSAGSHFSGRRSVVSSRAQREADEAAQQVSISGRNSIAYAQTRPGAAPYTELGQSTGAPGTPMKEPTRLQKKNPGLGLNIESASLATSAGPPSAPPTPGANTSPKQSWFAGLFNWKPASYTLLSTENFSVTSTEIRRLLQNYGVRVLIEDSESYGTLKCTVGEVRDPSGSSTVTKPVRFRVEFTILPVGSVQNSPQLSTPGRSPQPSPVMSTFSRDSAGSESPSISARRGKHGSSASSVMSGNGSLRSSHAPSLRNNGGVYATSVLLVQEKGALSTFKVLYNRLRRDWELDAPRSPGIGIGLGVAGASPQLR